MRTRRTASASLSVILALVLACVGFAPAPGADGEHEDITAADIRYWDDESPGGRDGWAVYGGHQDGAGSYTVRVDDSEPVRHDGSLRLMTPGEGDQVVLNRGVVPDSEVAGPPLAEFTGSYWLNAVSGSPAPYTLTITCEPLGDSMPRQPDLTFAGPFPDGPGWRAVDVDRGGEAMWWSRYAVGTLAGGRENPHTLQEYKNACPAGRISHHGFRLNEPGSESHVDAVTFNGRHTNFLVPPLRRIAPISQYMQQCGATCEAWYGVDEFGKTNPRPQAAVVANKSRWRDQLVAGTLANAVHGLLIRIPNKRPEPGCCIIPPASVKVYLVGNTDVLDESIARHYRRRGHEVVRIGGSGHDATAVKVAEVIAQHRPAGKRESVFLASGTPHEGMVAAAVAGAREGSLLLTRGDTLPPAVARYVARRPQARLVAVGAAAARATRHLAGVTRVAGSTPYATSANVASKFFPRVRQAVITAGQGFPEDLTAGVYAGQVRAPLLLVGRDGVPTPVRAYAVQNRDRLRASVLIGSTASMTEETFIRLFRLLTPG